MTDKSKLERLIKAAVAWWIDPLLLNEKNNFFIREFKISGQIQALETVLKQHLEKESASVEYFTLSTMYGAKSIFREVIKEVGISDDYFPTQTVMLVNFTEQKITIGQTQIFPAIAEPA